MMIIIIIIEPMDWNQSQQPWKGGRLAATLFFLSGDFSPA